MATKKLSPKMQELINNLADETIYVADGPMGTFRACTRDARGRITTPSRSVTSTAWALIERGLAEVKTLRAGLTLTEAGRALAKVEAPAVVEVVETSTTTQPEATQTPRQIDEQLANLHSKAQAVNARIAKAHDAAHAVTGEKRNRNKRNPWNTTHAQAVAKVRDMITAGKTRQPWEAYCPTQVIADLEAAKADLVPINAAIAVLDAEYARRPWNRFFLVTSSDGHIHRHTACSTCYPTTEFGWLPELSGKTEADAVAEHGTILCSVCFPTAPVAWTAGRTVEGRCSGGGLAPAGEVNTRYRTPFAQCTGCGTNQTVTQAGLVKNHKTPKDAKATPAAMEVTPATAEPAPAVETPAATSLPSDISERFRQLAEYMVEALPAADAPAFAAAITQAVTAGADLDRVADRMTIAALTDPEYGAARYATPTVRVAVSQVAELYRRRLAGDEPSSNKWDNACTNAHAAGNAATAAGDVAADAAAYATGESGTAYYAATYAVLCAGDAAAHSACDECIPAGYAMQAAAEVGVRDATRRWQAATLLRLTREASKAPARDLALV